MKAAVNRILCDSDATATDKKIQVSSRQAGANKKTAREFPAGSMFFQIAISC